MGEAEADGAVPEEQAVDSNARPTGSAGRTNMYAQEQKS